MIEEKSIEEFRKNLQVILTSKGVRPPSVDSDSEKVLYQKWLKGKEKLSQLKEKL